MRRVHIYVPVPECYRELHDFGSLDIVGAMSFAPSSDNDDCDQGPEGPRIIGYSRAPMTLGTQMQLNADALAQQYALMQQARSDADAQCAAENQYALQMEMQEQGAYAGPGASYGGACGYQAAGPYGRQCGYAEAPYYDASYDAPGGYTGAPYSEYGGQGAGAAAYAGGPSAVGLNGSTRARMGGGRFFER
eukprot:2829855-Rhodomonas_salina.1